MPQLRYRLDSRRIALAVLLMSFLVLLGSGLSGSHLTGATLLVGNNSVQSFGDTDAAGSAEALQYTATSSGTVGSLSLYVDSGNAATSVNVALYSDAGGNPGTLLTSGTLSHPTPAAWNSVAVPPAAVAAGTKYWLALLGLGGQVNFRDVASGGGATQNSAQTNLSGLPQTWSSGSHWANSPASFFADANVSSTPTPAPATPTPTSGPMPINNVPCTVTVNGGQVVGACTGTFTADTTPTPTPTSTATPKPTPPPTSTPAPTPTPTATHSKGCFAAPGACGFPDPSYHNVGASNCSALPKFNPANLPAGTYYSGSGNDLEITANNVTLSNLNLGNFNIYISSVNNFTLNNVCMNVDGGDDEGSMGIIIPAGVTGTVIENSTISGINSTSQSLGAAVDNNGSGTIIKNNYVYNVGGGAPGAGGGSADVENNYELVNANVPNEHYEPIYCSDNTLTINHNTLLNVQPQTADIFCNTGGGSGGACDNHLAITNNLMAGGGYMLYPCGNASSVGSSTVNVSGNRFSRGYFPGGGSYGVDAYVYCPPTGGQTWANNVWDDSNASVGC